MVIETDALGTPFEISIEARHGARMQWHKPALAILRLSDVQSVCCDVVEAQLEGFGYAQPSRGQKGEQRAIRPRPQ